MFSVEPRRQRRSGREPDVAKLSPIECTLDVDAVYDASSEDVR
jgi:hypothetical protein